MYLTAPRWKGQSVVGPMGSKTGLRGLGNVCVTTDPDFNGGSCIASGGVPYTSCTCLSNGVCQEDGNSCSTSTSLTQAGYDSLTGPAPKGGTGTQTLSQWLNANATNVGIAVAVGLGLLMFAHAGK